MKHKIAKALAALIAATTAIAVFPACGKSEPDLVYGNWNLSTEAVNNVERQMIKEFEKLNNVKIQIEESLVGTGNAYDDTVVGLAMKNKLPDVFMISNMNFGLEKKFVSEISDLVNADASGDWNKIPKPIEEAVHFKSGIYAVPFQMHMMGYFANMDLLAEKGLTKKLNGEFTYEVFEDIVKSMSNYKTSGIMGLSHENTVFEWYPASVNADYGWYTWDGAKYHLDSQEFKDGMAKTAALRTGGYTYDSLSEVDRNSYFEGVTGYVSLWDNGKLALRWGQTYEVPDMIKNSDFDKKFLGVPGGRTPIVGDYVAISNTCKNRELAYKFAKWMSFDPAGIKKRIALESEVTNTLPVSTDSAVISEYFTKFTSIEGLEEAFSALDNGIVECTKVVPGYNRARWKATTGISITDGVTGDTIGDAEVGKYIDQCWLGYYNYADKATELNTLANSTYTAAIKKFESYYK